MIFLFLDIDFLFQLFIIDFMEYIVMTSFDIYCAFIECLLGEL